MKLSVGCKKQRFLENEIVKQFNNQTVRDSCTLSSLIFTYIETWLKRLKLIATSFETWNPTTPILSGVISKRYMWI